MSANIPSVFESVLTVNGFIKHRIQNNVLLFVIPATEGIVRWCIYLTKFHFVVEMNVQGSPPQVPHFVQMLMFSAFLVLGHRQYQCLSNVGPRAGTGPWHQLYRAARGCPGVCNFSFLSNFHE